MTTLRCIIAPDPARLLRRAVDGLFPLAPSTSANPWPTLPAWMVLRQGGLRDDLHALAASAGVPGWFDPPVCLFGELASRWHNDGSRPLSMQDRAVLLSSLLTKHGRGVFGKDGHADSWVPIVDRFIGDLVGEGVTPDAFVQAIDSRNDRDEFERNRDLALASIYDEWLAVLARLGRTDGRDSRVGLAAAISADSSSFATRLGHRRDIRIVGLADLRGGWTSLLAALATSPAVDTVTIIASHALSFPSSLSVETECDREAGDAAHVPTKLFIEAPDAVREVEIVAARVRALIDAGVEPHRVAVVARQARPLVDDVSHALVTLGVPVTARRRVALSHTGPARALRALLAAAAEGWSRHGILELAEHPLLSLGLDATVLEFVGRESPLRSCEAWTSALERLLQRSLDREQLWGKAIGRERERALPQSTRVAATLDAWHTFLVHAQWLDGDHTLVEWFSWMHGVLTADYWGIASRLAAAPAGDRYVLRSDCKACDRIISLAADSLNALQSFGISEHSRVNADQFSAQLSIVLSEDLILQPETGFGVVVAEGFAAGWRSFQHLFVVGLASGEFPLPMPVSPLLSDGDRTSLIAAGLPLDPTSAWRSRERELFRVLCAAPTDSLVLSWPAMSSEGREVARSSYVQELIDEAALAAGPLEGEQPDETLQRVSKMLSVPPQEVITDGFPIVARLRTIESIEHARRVSAIERERLRALSPWNGAIEDLALVADLKRRYGLAYVWSATSIEELAKCSYSWMAKRLLRLEDSREADDAIEPLVTGRILHSALQRFFDAEIRRRGGPVYLTAADRTMVPTLISSSLDAAWNAEEAVSWLGVPAMRTFVKAGLLEQLNAYLEFEISYNESRDNNRTNSAKSVHTGAIRGELAFDGVTITTDHTTFLLRGSIDRIDQSCDTRLTDSKTYLAAIDYKSSKSSTPAGGDKRGWDDGVVLQVPLYAKVIQQLMPESDLARFEYRTLRSPAIVHQLQFHGVKSEGKPGKKTFSVSEIEGASLKFTDALSAAARRVEQVQRGEFPASPAPSCGCSPYCSARDVCRLPGGPAAPSQAANSE